ncbi:MAG: fimbria/pilus outer membrane usher protein [Geminicoccaceae bacterium]|nr:fimbria/pilus outer membrane usher protein [Geminicoccaceae bacterium]
MARSTSSFLSKAASLATGAGLLALWSGLGALGSEELLDPASASAARREGRLLRLIVANRQREGELPLPARASPNASAEPAAAAGPIPAPPVEKGPEPAAAAAPPASLSPSASPPDAVPKKKEKIEGARVVPAQRTGEVVPPRRSLRRDPLEPPLREEGWREWVFAVVLNGKEVSEGSLLAEEPGTGRLALPVSQLRLWRIRVDPAKALTLQGEPFVPLDAIEGARFSIDREALVVRLDLPPEAFEGYAVEAAPEPAPPPTSASGAFLDYDLAAIAGEGVRERLDGLAEAGLFGPWGVFTTSALFLDLASDPEIVRLETRFSRDFPEKRASLRIGDSVTGAGSFAAPARFGGIQWATNFATDPSFVTFPLPAIGGLAEQPATVEVFIENFKRAIGEVPPGPFTFTGLPVVTGAGEVQLKVTDLLGRERILTQPYYVSARNLKAGLHEYSYEAGFERRRYGETGFRYGDALLSATHRYGFTDAVTGEVHALLQTDRQGLVLGGTFQLGLWGTLTAGIGASHDGDRGFGAMGQIAYEYLARGWSFGAKTRLTSEGWSELGGRPDVRRVDQLNFGLDLGVAGRLGLFLANEERDRRDDRTVAAASWSLALGPGAFLLSAGQSLRPEREFALTLAYVVPLGERTTLSTEARAADGRANGRLQLRHARGASDLGFDLRLGAEIGDQPRSYDARVSYQGALGAVELEAERFAGEHRLRLGVEGSLALVDGTLRASRRLGQAFGLVDVPGFPDVRVYLDNREVGRTDAEGKLLLPGLRPYEINRVRLELDDLPLGANLERAETVAVPFERSGVRIAFPIDHRRRAKAMLRDGAGAPLPAGLELVAEDGTTTALLGRDGFAMITGPLARPVEVVGRLDGTEFRCPVPSAPAEEPLADLGEIRCR